MSDSPAPLWRALVSSDPTRPFVTTYDSSGGRVELSRATFDNWVSKTSNMLVDGLGAQPGDRVAVALPVHWQSLVWLVACWSVGAVAVPGASGEVPGETQFAVTDADRLAIALDAGAEEVVGTSLHPLGMPLTDVPPMVTDYSVEVRGHGDHFAPYPLDPAAPALETDRVRSGADLVESARKRAGEWNLADSDRVAVLADPSAPLTVLGQDASAFVATIVAGTPLVLTPADTDGLTERLTMERVTAVLGAGGRDGTGASIGPEFRTLA